MKATIIKKEIANTLFPKIIVVMTYIKNFQFTEILENLIKLIKI